MMNVDIESIAREVRLNGYCIISDIDFSYIDDIYERCTERLLDDTFIGPPCSDEYEDGNIRRLKRSKYFTTVNIRSENHIIAPHCEFKRHFQPFELGFFFCKTQPSIGGYTCLIHNENITQDMKFSYTNYDFIFFRVPWKLIYKRLYLLPKLSLGVFLMLIRFYVCKYFPYLRDCIRSSVISYFIRRLVMIRISNVSTHSTSLINKVTYQSPMYVSTYYDIAFVKAFRSYISKQGMYYNFKKADSALKEESFRYMPYYDSKTDFSPLYSNCITHLLRPNQMMVFNNKRFMHGATQFQGDRDILAAFC